ncbi:hypothetical protein LBMAG27_22430 [Bacteroidota bacterium]|nr:hypothetical protein LBMAG27_22430 [Bacteroidota bacterium]
MLKGHREWKQNIKKTPVDRQLRTKQYFVDYFSKKGYSARTSEFIYDKTQIYLRAKGIILLPHDDFIVLYERQQDEWFYIFKKWFDAIGKNHPNEKTLNELLLKHKKINFEYLHDLFDKQF